MRLRSTSNGRAVEVVHFLASHSTESFALSEIAARLKLSQVGRTIHFKTSRAT